jgi:hypothetical protein
MRFRIDPADEAGFHFVDVENGGEQVYIPYKKKKEVADMIMEVEP